MKISPYAQKDMEEEKKKNKEKKDSQEKISNEIYDLIND